MLALTPEAIEALKTHILSSPKVPEGAGLRIFVKGEERRRNERVSISLGSAIVDEPNKRDRVIEKEGVRIFIDPYAASVLKDKLLDITVEGARINFQLSNQT